LEEVDASDPMAGLRGIQNLLVLSTSVLGDLAVHQLDGGLDQTAYGLVADLVTIGRRHQARER